VEPQTLWKELLNTAISDIKPEKTTCEVLMSVSLHVKQQTHRKSIQGIRMVQHVLATYHTHDEEMEAIHLPIIFSAVLETVNVSTIPTVRFDDI
jgi:hypothetical protein